MRANRWNVSRYVRSSSPVWRANVTAASRVSSAISRPARRTGMHCTRTRSLAPIACVSASTELAVAPRPREQRPLDLVDDGADEVLRVVGLAGDRPHLREHDEAVTLLARDRREQHEVGEREVGERAPAGDQPLEVHEIGPAEPRAQPGQIVERAHRRW